MALELKQVNEEFEKFLEELDSEKIDKEKIRTAYEFSKSAHAFQKRQNGDPYITHPLEVARIVNQFGLDQVSIISALLHDVVEDTEVTLEKIREEFGGEVEIIVDGLSKIQIFGESKEEKNIAALRKILLASAKDIRVLVIKLCDRLHNMRTLEELPESKRTRIAKETLRIYVPIAQKIGIYSLKWELEDLAFKYRDPDMYEHIKEKLRLTRTEREEIVKKAVDEIKDVLYANGITEQDVLVLGRPKNFYSIYKKIKNKAKSFEDLFDLYAIRIITKDVTQCYTVLGILHENFQPFPDRLKDYIANPKSNGYQSIHSIVYSKRIRHPIEIQIRTEEMHKLAEFGVAAHWRYKNLEEDKKFEKKISWLREVLQWENEHKDSQEFFKLLKFDFFEDEVFVFTPKNEVFTLPEGATALDFAFAVHTDIGKTAYKAKINGLVTPLDKKLKSGDIVEIVTNKSVKPSEKWLKFVVSSKARIKIKQAINLKHSGKREKEDTEVSFEQLKEHITRLEEFKKVRKAGCCSFQYKDQIVGVVGKSGELVVHNASCENAKYTIKKKIPLRWKEENDKEVNLSISLKDRFGLLMDILNIFSEFNLNISKLNTKVQKDGNVKMDISVIDGPHIDSITNKLNKLDNVNSVKVSRGFFG